MPFNGSGTFTRLYNWVTDRNNGVKIRADRMDAEFDGIATGLSTAMLRDGTSTATANLRMGGFRLRNFGNDIPATTAGTSTAYTLTSGESLADGTVYDGVTVAIRPHTTSGATPTIAVDTMTARAIRRQDGGQVGAGELVANGTYRLTFRAADTSWYVVGAALPAVTGNATRFLRVNSAGTALEFAAVGSITRSARTSNTILGVSDGGAMIDVTSGTFTQTVTAAATLQAGWFCYYRNSGTGIVTIDPNASETIDGRTTINVYPGEEFLIQCDGTSFFTIGRDQIVTLTTSSVTGTPATFDIEGGAFDDTEIHTIEVHFSAVSGDSTGVLRFRLRAGGAYVTSSNYAFNHNGLRTGGTNVNNGSASSDNFPLFNGLAGAGTAASTQAGIIRIINKNTGTAGDHTILYAAQSSHEAEVVHGGGRVTTAAAIQGVRFYYSTGNLDAGTFRLVGYR